MTSKQPPVEVTANMAAVIKKLLKGGKHKQHEIAAMFGLNQGRISEINTGKRFPNIPPAQ